MLELAMRWINANWRKPVKQMRGYEAMLRREAHNGEELARAASGAEALDTKTKELIALAISVAVRCDPCIAFHAQGAVKQGASREEVMEAMGMAIYMGAGPLVMFASKAVEAYDQFKRQVTGI